MGLKLSSLVGLTGASIVKIDAPAAAGDIILKDALATYPAVDGGYALVSDAASHTVVNAAGGTVAAPYGGMRTNDYRDGDWLYWVGTSALQKYKTDGSVGASIAFTNYASCGGVCGTALPDVGVFFYKSASGVITIQAFRKSTMALLGTARTVNQNSTAAFVGAAIANVTYQGQDAIAILHLQSTTANRLTIIAVDGAGLAGSATLGTFDLVAGTETGDRCNLIASDDKTRLIAIFDSSGSQFAVLNMATGAVITPATAIGINSLADGRCVHLKTATGCTLFRVVNSTALQIATIGFDGSSVLGITKDITSQAAVAAGVATLGNACGYAQNVAGFAHGFFLGAYKSSTGNTTALRFVGLDESLNVTGNFYSDAFFAAGTEDTCDVFFAIPLEDTKTPTTCRVIIGGIRYDGTTTDPICDYCLLTSSGISQYDSTDATLFVSSNGNTDIPNSHVGFYGGLAFSWGQGVGAAAPRFLMPLARSPQGICMKAAGAGERTILLTTGEVNSTKSYLQNETAIVYDGTTGVTPIGKKLTVQSGHISIA